MVVGTLYIFFVWLELLTQNLSWHTFVSDCFILVLKYVIDLGSLYMKMGGIWRAIDCMSSVALQIHVGGIMHVTLVDNIGF